MADLLSVVVGTVLGAVLSVGTSITVQRYNHKLKTEEDDKRRRAEKIEELVSAIYEYDHWHEVFRRVYIYGENERVPGTPYWKVHAIAVVHFPELLLDIKELDLKAASLRLWAIKAGEKRLAGDTSTLHDGFEEVYGPYFDKKGEVLEKSADMAERYTN